MTPSYAVLSLAIAGAAASWIVAVMYFVRTLAALGPEDRHLRWRLMLAWLATVRRLKGAAARHAAVVHRAMLIFLVCILAAAGAVMFNAGAER